MSEKAWKKLWAIVCSAALLFGYAAVLRSRGVAMTSEFIDIGGMLPDASSILSFVVLAMLTWLSLLTTRRYALTQATKGWSGRLPILYFDDSDIDVDTNDGRLYQAITFTGLVVCPVLLLVVLYSSFLSYPAYFPSRAPEPPTEYARDMSHLVPSTVPTLRELLSGKFRYGTPGGPSYYPIIQPWLYLGVVFASLWHFVATLRALFRK